MFSQPDPYRMAHLLRESIRKNRRPQDMLYEFLNSRTKEANYLANTMMNNREILEIITSPEGRKWLHFWLDDTLNYLREFCKG